MCSKKCMVVMVISAILPAQSGLLSGLSKAVGSGNTVIIKSPAVSPSNDANVSADRSLPGSKTPPSGLHRSGGITLDVYAASAPNAFGSPSWSGYLVNALNALQNNLATSGTRATDPTGYERAPAVVPPGEIAVTSFASWRGIVSPPAPFAGEYGNRMHFGLHAYGDGSTKFKLEDLTFALHSDDPWDSLVYVGDFIGLSYNGTTRYGVNWGADNAPGGVGPNADTVYTSGNGTTLVDEIVYVGVGNAWWPSGGTPQSDMDDYFAWIASDGPFNVSCTYDIQGYTGTDSVLVEQVKVDDFGVQGWKSDDTRNAAGTDLVGTNYTHFGKPGQSPTTADDTAIASQLMFVSGPGGVPALELTKTSTGGNSKCTLSTVNPGGFASGDWRTGFYANYRYYATSGIEAAVLKIGIRSPLWGTGAGQSQNGFTAVRSGESAWDLILVDWRGTQPPWTVGAWDRFNTDANTQCWRIFRQGTNGFFNATPTPPGAQVGWSLNELYAMSTGAAADQARAGGYTWSQMLFGTGAKVASIQFGVGSSTGNTTSYIDYVDTSLLNGGARVDFWGPAPVTFAAYPSQVPDEQLPRVNLGDAPSAFGPDSWQNSATGKVNWHARYLADGDHLSDLFPSQAATLTVNDIASIRYWTKRPSGTAAGRDWWVYIYTRKTGSGDEGSFYKKRFINNYNEHTNIGSWTQYSTDNDMTFRKTSGTPTGLMSFDDLKTAYGTELVEMISVQTDSGWSGGFDGYMDGLTITLTSGSVGRVDFVKQPTLTLDPDDECYAPGETVTVEIRMHDVPTAVVGGQYFLQYDQTKLDFVSANPGDAPFTLELYESVNEGAGTIDYSVNAPSGDPGADGTAKMAVLTFNALTTLCTENNLIAWRAHDPPTRLSEPGGQAVSPETIDMDLLDDVDPVFTLCPANVTIECDESTLPANTGLATASDNCDATPTVTYGDVETPGSCPQEKTITRTWTATDDCGNSISTCIQTITVEDTTDPVITCPPNATIECDESILPSNTGITLSMPFNTNPTLSPTQAPGVWYTDRYPPFGFVSAVFGGGSRLKHSIDASACDSFACRGGFTGAFYNTQGRKYDLPAATTRMTIDLYIPSAWAATGRRMAGFWGTAVDTGNAVSAFPIIEFTSNTDTDGSGPRFRGWNDASGWVYMGLPTGFVYDTWYTLETTLVGANWVYKVGNLQLSIPALGSVRIDNVILQGHNTTAGVTYDIYWDNFASAQTVQAVDNCDSSPTVTYTDAPSLGGCDGTGTIARTWTATDDCGNDASCVQTITVEDTTDPVLSACPANINKFSDAGTCGAVVTYTPPTATDNCDASPTVVCTPASGSTFPTGLTTVTCTATDDCLNSSQCMFDVTVQSVSQMDVTVQLSPTMVAGPISRCITFEFRNCPSTTLLATSTQLMTFTSGSTGLVTVNVPCGNYDCVTARDRQHTLRRTDEGFGISGTKYVADFTGNPSGGGDWLIGGNLNGDTWIDILDFGVFSSKYFTAPGLITSCPGSPALHADINGDNWVDNLDFTFIQANFLKGNEANCCGAAGSVASGLDMDFPVERISIRELNRLGLSDLAAGDLNGDGWLDVQDIEAFAAGVRPDPGQMPPTPEVTKKATERELSPR